MHQAAELNHALDFTLPKTKERGCYSLLSTNTGNWSLDPDLESRKTPTFASTSTAPPICSGLVAIMWCTKSAISFMNSSNGSTPSIDSDNGGNEPPLPPSEDEEAYEAEWWWDDEDGFPLFMADE